MKCNGICVLGVRSTNLWQTTFHKTKNWLLLFAWLLV